MKLSIINALLCLSLLLCSGCKKHLFDYRNKYIGEWTFKVIRSIYGIRPTNIPNDFVLYNGEIKYGNNDNALLIKYTEQNSIELIVDKGGEFPRDNSQYGSGSFLGNEKLDLYLHFGGRGLYSIHQIEGTKK